MLSASAGAASSSSSSGGGNFLLPNGTFVFDLVIFLAVLGIIAKWILPPLLEVAETRRARIRSELQGAEEARAEVKRLRAERDRMLTEARAQARSIIDDANQGADQTLEATRLRGQEEFDRLLAAAQEEAESDSRRVREELVGRLDALVVAAAERVLGSRVDADRHRALIDEAIATAAGQG